jgi:hypothetical protein
MLDDTKGLIAGIVICAIVIVVIIAILCCMCRNKEGFTPAQRMRQSQRYKSGGALEGMPSLMNQNAGLKQVMGNNLNRLSGYPDNSCHKAAVYSTTDGYSGVETFEVEDGVNDTSKNSVVNQLKLQVNGGNPYRTDFSMANPQKGMDRNGPTEGWNRGNNAGTKPAIIAGCNKGILLTGLGNAKIDSSKMGQSELTNAPIETFSSSCSNSRLMGANMDVSAFTGVMSGKVNPPLIPAQVFNPDSYSCNGSQRISARFN